jgi:disulfide bond formation protein DsbB
MIRPLEAFLDPKTAVAVCALASAALIAGAHLFERVGGMPPCLLCLDQREAHWAAIAISLIAMPLLIRHGEGYRIGAAALGAMVLVYVFSAGLAAYHAGVEWKFWEGPATCAASPENVDLDLVRGGDVLASLTDTSSDAPPCNEAAWRMLGISMAGYNAVISLLLAMLAGASCGIAAKGLRRDRVGSALAAD